MKEKYLGRLNTDGFNYFQHIEIVRANSYQPVKRIFDLFGASVLLVFLFPILLSIWIILFVTNNGNVFFNQERVGLFGRRFVLHKFQTMVDSPNTLQTFAEINDPRITKVGRFLRITHLDELPQLWNVMKGEMSLIGPRPEQVSMTALITEQFPLFSLRHSVRPGITGWAQVNQGYVASIDASKTKLEFDLWYIKNMSLALDLKIACMTVAVILFQSGSR